MVLGNAPRLFATARQLGRGLGRKAIVENLRPAIFDRHILTHDVAGFFQSLSETISSACVSLCCATVQKSDYRHRRLLLRARRRQV
jgi:hypothetical protein